MLTDLDAMFGEAAVCLWTSLNNLKGSIAVSIMAWPVDACNFGHDLHCSVSHIISIFWKHNKGEQVSIAPVASCSPLSSHPSNDWGTQPCGQTLLGSIYHLQQWQKTSLVHSISILGLLRERRPASAKFCARTAGSSLHLPRNQKMGACSSSHGWLLMPRVVSGNIHTTSYHHVHKSKIDSHPKTNPYSFMQDQKYQYVYIYMYIYICICMLIYVYQYI